MFPSQHHWNFEAWTHKYHFYEHPDFVTAQVSVSVSQEKAEPGAEVEVIVRASPDSTIGLLAVDQSVLLLKSGNDITPELVEEDIGAYDTTRWSGGWGGPWGPGRPLPLMDGRRRRKRSIWFPWVGGKDAATVFQVTQLLCPLSRSGWDRWLFAECGAQGAHGCPAL